MKKILLTLLVLVFTLGFVFALDNTATSSDTAKANINSESVAEGRLPSGADLELKTLSEVAELYGINANKYTKRLGKYYGLEFKTGNKIGSLVDVYGLEPKVALEVADSIANGNPMPGPITTEKEEKGEYHLSPIVLILVGGYVLSRILSKKKINILTIINHKKIWNILLIISFVISGALGVLLVIRNNKGITGPMRFDALFWHVELGIAMVIISIFHIAERWYYFKRIFSRKKKLARKRKPALKINPNAT